MLPICLCNCGIMLKPRVTLLLIFKCVVSWMMFSTWAVSLLSPLPSLCKSESLRAGDWFTTLSHPSRLWTLTLYLSSMGTACSWCTWCACRQIPVLMKRGGRDVRALCSFSNSPLLASTVALAFCLYEFDSSSASHEWGHYSTRPSSLAYFS